MGGRVSRAEKCQAVRRTARKSVRTFPCTVPSRNQVTDAPEKDRGFPTRPVNPGPSHDEPRCIGAHCPRERVRKKSHILSIPLDTAHHRTARRSFPPLSAAHHRFPLPDRLFIRVIRELGPKIAPGMTHFSIRYTKTRSKGRPPLLTISVIHRFRLYRRSSRAARISPCY